MGRSNALPSSFLRRIDPKHQVPRNNGSLVGRLALIGSFFSHLRPGIELLNFGAFDRFYGCECCGLRPVIFCTPKKRKPGILSRQYLASSFALRCG